jgi:hypothetical protein
VGAGLVAVRTRLDGTPESLYCVGPSCRISWQLVPVPDGLVEERTIGKGNKTLGFIRRNLKDCTKPVKSAAYTSMVRPTMEYASSVWDPTNREKIGNLEKVQKRAARFVFNNYTDRTPGCVTKMVESLKWKKLEERRKYNRLCMLQKIKNGFIDVGQKQ